MPCERMAAGQVVLLDGLSKAELNGQIGRIRQWDEAGGRYIVDFAGRGLLVLPENLTLMPGA